MKKKTVLICFICLAVALAQMSFRRGSSGAVDHTIAYFNSHATEFSADALQLQKAVAAIDTANKASIENAKKVLMQCRQQYKKISFFLEYFFPSEAHVFNAAAVTEVEDADLEFIEPMGLQQLESLLFEKKINAAQLKVQCEALYSSAADIHSLLYGFKATDAQVLESVRIELVRIITLYITGYDAPELKTGIAESKIALQAIQQVLNFYGNNQSASYQLLQQQLGKAIDYLSKHTDFDSFSRMEFLIKHALPLQQNLGAFIRSSGLEINTQEYLNYNVPNIFSRGAIKAPQLKNNAAVNGELLKLGNMLFTEKALSVNNTRSCATCHKPGEYFTDMLPKSLALNGHATTVARNAPSLLYASMQHAQFWDGRAASTEELVKMVILNTEEMNGDEKIIMQRLMQQPSYINSFKNAFPALPNKALGLTHISKALAAFLQTLNPLNSAFDRYIQTGDSSAMSQDAVYGFNLFMGKAKCGTCHFAPLFNSSLPPFYNVAEYEVIGTTANDDLDHPLADKDAGRFTTVAVKYYNGAFKTPTVRNAAKTAPYMHNGAFKTLDAVVEFYNRGGGNGIGINSEVQTLSSGKLSLTPAESKQLVAFMNALTDEPISSSIITNNQHKK